MRGHHMTSQCITWHHTTQEIASHKMKTHQITSHDMTWHLATNHIPSPRVISQPTTKFRISPGNQPHQNRSPHHHHGTAEGSFTQKTRFGHRSGWSPCAHSIGKFFLWLIGVFFLETSAPGLPGSTCSSQKYVERCEIWKQWLGKEAVRSRVSFGKGWFRLDELSKTMTLTAWL